MDHQYDVVTQCSFAEGGHRVGADAHRYSLHLTSPRPPLSRTPCATLGRRPQEQTVRAAFIDIDGTRTRYLYEGDAGETLLLIHGFGLSADIWAHVLDPLAAQFSVYAPDILGHGFTDFKEPGARRPRRS